jgi:hypothetical protein
VTFDVEPASSSGLLEVFDASGRLVDRFAIHGATRRKLEGSLAAGVYFVRVRSGEPPRSGVAKLVVIP